MTLCIARKIKWTAGTQRQDGMAEKHDNRYNISMNYSDAFSFLVIICHDDLYN
jgi:hypothetical protein